MTIRSYLEQGKLPNAFQTPKGKSKTWNIPLTDLVMAGLLDEVKTEIATPKPSEPADYELKLLVATLEAENRFLKEALTDAKDALKRSESRIDRLLVIREIETKEAQNKRRRWFKRNQASEIDTMPTFTANE